MRATQVEFQHFIMLEKSSIKTPAYLGNKDYLRKCECLLSEIFFIYFENTYAAFIHYLNIFQVTQNDHNPREFSLRHEILPSAVAHFLNYISHE